MTEKVALITGVTGQDGSYLAELLLAKGADVNAKANHGLTTLMVANCGVHNKIREMLIKAGAK